jgi:ADP-ribose pyrophosphatase
LTESAPLEPTSSHQVFAGTLLDVRVESWPAGEREVVRHPGACAVVALTPSGRVVLVRQFREAIRSWLLEIPAGIRDVDDEPTAECAARELVEETGYRAMTIEPLGSILTSAGFSDERIDLFVAQTTEEPHAGPCEAGVEVVMMPYEAALAAVRDGRVEDAKTIAALLMCESKTTHPR